LVEPVQEVIEEKPKEIVEVIEEVKDLEPEEITEEVVEVISETLNVPEEDVVKVVELAKTEEAVAEAIDTFEERAEGEEDYTLADAVVEVQFENFIEDPIEVLIDIDLEEISFESISDSMTTDQKEKAQEVVVPVILTRIATMAAFIFRKTI